MTTKPCSSCNGSGQRIETYSDDASVANDPNFGFPEVRVKTKTRYVQCGNCHGKKTTA